MMAAALTVEILASLMQHPLKAQAPASTKTDLTFLDDSHEKDGSCLGLVPHQIRGFLSKFSQILPSVRRFDSCVACSPQIIAEYRHRGWEFVKDVLNSPKSLENITGLTRLHETTENMDVFELSDSESI